MWPILISYSCKTIHLDELDFQTFHKTSSLCLDSEKYRNTHSKEERNPDSESFSWSSESLTPDLPPRFNSVKSNKAAFKKQESVSSLNSQNNNLKNPELNTSSIDENYIFNQLPGDIKPIISDTKLMVKNPLKLTISDDGMKRQQKVVSQNVKVGALKYTKVRSQNPKPRH